MINADDIIWPAADFSRVPFAVYTSSEVYDREQERIFHGPVWLYLGLQAEIPGPGDFMPDLRGRYARRGVPRRGPQHSCVHQPLRPSWLARGA